MRRLQGRAQARKSHHIVSSSGDAPQTHPSLAGEGVTSAKKVGLRYRDVFVCANAVDPAKLLRATRDRLLEMAESIGANALVDERWEMTVCGPKHRNDGSFRVYVEYSAKAARAAIPDPRKPVALQNAKGVPGLMTITHRDE
ncbi:hypothetical protein PUNSTDRAFT_68484 [Punctularia strigosozonata HHB-11173 SS5]|uniref:uncharacterized protein n=1 Tax=Punctularia strigosozonata (strain HHB-11173) TaxID=741275 RepID=UPI000441669C|nr:uncharacterized protein PUNSTDRAFT_68484 [Punctularia strigosozonata HHB-11173 SS5]EIN08359.1 hypothetical protein PUNSTDRAFT_68484 [Punctularia strigosozonata HHB-11173 SS5]